MRVPTVSVAEDGSTYFRDTDLPFEAADFTPPSPAGYWTTQELPAQQITIMRTPAGYVDEWHPAPYHVLTSVLSGLVRVESSDGDSRVIEAGGIFINEDVEGQGHRLTEVNDAEYVIMLVQLAKAPG